MVLPPRLPGTRPRASARTACVPYTATLWREHRVQDREHYPVLRSGSPVFAGQPNRAARGAAAMSHGAAGWPERTLRPLWPDQPWEGLAELGDPVDEHDRVRGGQRGRRGQEISGSE